MNRTISALCLGLFMVLTIVGCGGTSTPPANRQTGSIPLPKTTPQPLVGVSAIKPADGETITKEDVIRYVQTHNIPLNSANLSTHKIENIILTTTKEVNLILNRKGTPLPDNYPLWFVTFTGTFSFPLPPVAKENKKPFAYERAFEVFDAKTGNLLMGGGLAPLPPVG